MKIISNFKDYYDYISKIYGGGDPKIVYLRPRRQKMKFCKEKLSILNKNETTKRINTLNNIFRVYDHKDKNFIQEVSFKGLIIGNIFFTLIKYRDDKEYRILDKNDLINLNDLTNNKLKKPFLFYRKNKYVFEDLINVKDDTLNSICRTFNIPVFTFFSDHEGIYIDEEYPMLGEIGIGKYISDNQMYQHLSYFIGNLIKLSPDMMPVIETSDKDKIVSHGFDLKTSFRNM